MPITKIGEQLVKEGGTGWDLHGYSLTPKQMMALRSNLPSGDPDSDEMYDYMEKARASRVKIPGLRTNYKLNRHIGDSIRGGLAFDDLDTDEAYVADTYSRALPKSRLAEIRRRYTHNVDLAKKQWSDYHTDPLIRPGVDAFLQKLNALEKNPKVQSVRLEWE